MGIYKKIFSLIFFICLSVSTGAETFQFKYQQDVKYKMLTTVEGKVFINGYFDHSVETLYKIAVEVLDVKEESGQIAGVFQTSEKASLDEGLFKLSEEEYRTVYWRDARGRYSSVSQQLLPQVRNVPLFPEEDLVPGDSWEDEGEEVFDLREFGITEPVHVPLRVNYIYVKKETLAGVECAVFQIYYSFVLNLGRYTGLTDNYPLKITGHSNQRYFFDVANGRPHSYEDTFDRVYLFTSGDIFEFNGRSQGEVIEGTDLDKDKMIKEIEEVIQQEGIEDTAVEKSDEGVKLILEDINFLPESDVLVPKEQEKLSKIAKILINYPDKDLLISGHTALAGTEAGRQLLSERRARAVGEFLLNLGVREVNQLVYRGLGAREPVADNATTEGRKKNRRVEIMILEN